MRKESFLEPRNASRRETRAPSRCAASSSARARRGPRLPRRHRRAAKADRRNRRATVRAPRFVFARRGHELGEVLDPAFGLFAPLLAQILQVAALVEDLAERDRDRFVRAPSRSARRSNRGTRSSDCVARGASRRRSTACTRRAQSELLVATGCRPAEAAAARPHRSADRPPRATPSRLCRCRVPAR